MSLLRSLRDAFRGPAVTPLERLGIEMAGPPRPFEARPWTGLAPDPYVQAISPGRSGTRWLADLVRDCTPHAVVHAASESLAETGFLFDQGRVSRDEAFGAYMQVRGRTIEHCRALGCGLVDLDCKLSPLAPVLLDRFPTMRFAVVMREPVAFVASGIARGYFRDHHPQLHGHLVGPGSGQSVHAMPAIEPASQALAIARFWNRVALIGQRMHAVAAERTVLFDMSAMFASRVATRERLESLGLVVDAARLDSYGSFDVRKNVNRATSPPFRLDAIAPSIRQVAYEGLSREFLDGCGLGSAPEQGNEG